MKRNPLIGHCFHTLNPDDNSVNRQGVVLSSPEPGWYLVQYFDWLVGNPSYQQVVYVAEMSKWLFYSNAEEMHYSYEHGTAREGGPYRRNTKKP